MSAISKLVSLVTARETMTKTPQSQTDYAVVRVDLSGSPAGFTGRDGVTYFDGDERIMTPDELGPYRGNMKNAPFKILGWIPKPKPPAIEGPARTIHVRPGSDLMPPSEHLDRRIGGGETVELPAAEAMRYVRAGDAQLAPASARAELVQALAVLATGTNPDAAAAVVVALDDTLRAYGVHMPATRDRA
jgi:hypothetical protein